MDEKRYWFRKKRFGWGWTPATSEGWIATLGFVAIIVGGMAVLMPVSARTAPWAPAAWVLGWSAALVVLAAKTGEPLG
jgi:hypothetical protein